MWQHFEELHELLCVRLCAAQIKYCIISPRVVRWQLLTGFETVKKVHNDFIVAGISGNEENVNPISTGGGEFHPPIYFLPVTFLFLSQFPPNLVTFPKI